jgi:glycerol-3-phosphate dehydrogenase
MYDVAIIGAGVVGAVTARTLAKFNLHICILEKEADVAMGATKANSAIVHAGFDAKEGSLKAKLNVKGAQMMPQLCQELGVPYKKNGSLVVGFYPQDREVLETLLARGIKNGVPGLRILEKEELLAIEPNLSDEALFALYAPTGAIICPYTLAIAAVGNAMDNGAELKCNFEVCAIEEIEDGYRLRSETEQVEAHCVINCAGCYSDKIAACVDDDSFTVHPRKGEYVLLDRACGDLVKHTVFPTPSKMGKGILVTPTVHGNLLLGPTSEDMQDKENKETTQTGMDKVLASAGKTLRKLPAGKAITSFCGLRAVGSTGDFIIRSPKRGFVHAAGIESPGLSASPAIAEYIVSILQAQGFCLAPKEGYNPIRKPMHAFHNASIEEKNAWIKKAPAYGKIVCRCEGITEGEILEAIRTNPKATDLDGVKRRTRGQMGRCQGGFCSPQIAELLAREQGVSLKQITKFGGNSKINLQRTKGGAER